MVNQKIEIISFISINLLQASLIMYTAQVLPIELWQTIFNYSDIKTQLYLMFTQTDLQYNLYVTDLYNISGRNSILKYIKI